MIRANVVPLALIAVGLVGILVTLAVLFSAWVAVGTASGMLITAGVLLLAVGE